MILRALVLTLVLYGCTHRPTLPSDGDPAPANIALATDSTYGYTEQNPIKVGGVSRERGPQNQRAFLNALRGPGGERVQYQRQGSCCQYKTPNGMIAGLGALDIYEVTYQGLSKPLRLYLNMYDYEQPRIPRGFTWAP
jgi:hypothetical protein